MAETVEFYDNLLKPIAEIIGRQSAESKSDTIDVFRILAIRKLIGPVYFKKTIRKILPHNASLADSIIRDVVAVTTNTRRKQKTHR